MQRHSEKTPILHQRIVDTMMTQLENLPTLNSGEVTLAIHQYHLGLEALEQLTQSSAAIDQATINTLSNMVAAGVEARKLLIQSNRKLVVFIAKRYKNLGVPFEDIIQQGNLGLMQAINKFDPDQNFAFSTYATFWIKQSIIRYISQDTVIRIPVYLKELIDKVKKAETNGEKVEPSASGSTNINRALQALQTSSLDEPVSNEVGFETVHELVADETDVPAIVLNTLEVGPLQEFFEEYLNPREEQIIKMIHGINPFSVSTLSEIAEKMRLSEYTISNDRYRAYKKIRLHLFDFLQHKAVMDELPDTWFLPERKS